MAAKHDIEDTKRYWPVMGFYERFEQVVALALTAVISVIIVIALVQLVTAVVQGLILHLAQPIDHRTFQRIFGMIMTLLIAMEFKHSILPILARKAAIVQVRTVLLIAMLAVSRKFIIMDFQAVSAANLAGLAFSMIAIGAVYWFLRAQELREQQLRRPPEAPPNRP